MKMQRHLLYIAWLAVCMLLVLSACGGPTPSAGRAAETVTPAVRSDTPASPTTVVPSTEPPESTGSPTAGVSPNPAATATEAIPTPPPTPTGTLPPPSETPPPPATPTPPAKTAEPTDAATPTEAPTATSTPEALAAPVIEGLKLVDGKYVAEKGNPYGVKVGEEVGNVRSVLVLTKVSGPVDPETKAPPPPEFVRKPVVCLTNQIILKILSERQANSNIENWQIPLPIKPGINTVIQELITPEGVSYLTLNYLPPDSILVNPYPTPIKVSRLRSASGRTNIKFYDERAGNNWGPLVIFEKAARVYANDTPKVMQPGSILAEQINGKVVLPNGQQVQAILTTSALNSSPRPGPSFALNNLSMIGNAFICRN